MGKKVYLSGQRFGRLLVVERLVMKGWLCICDCGNKTIQQTNPLQNGGSKSCGCYKRDVARSKRHLEKVNYQMPGFHSWRGMVERCTNPNHDKYKNYGGRGIRVCDRWRIFKNFYIDMGEKPSPKHSIDRIDTDGDYCPENCKWSDQVEQCRNKKSYGKNTSGCIGVHWNKRSNKWVASITVANKKKVSLGYYVDINDAIKARKEAEQKYWGRSS